MEEKLRVGEAELQVIKGGSGKPLLVLHGELGDPGWLDMAFGARNGADPLDPAASRLSGKSAYVELDYGHARVGGVLCEIRARAESR